MGLVERVAARAILKPLSQETMGWLQEWMLHAPRGLPPQRVIEELSPFRPTSPIQLWRYVENPGPEKSKLLLSWVDNIGDVLNASFNDSDDILIRTAIVAPKDILVHNRILVAKMWHLHPNLRDLIIEQEITTFQPGG